MKKKLLICLFIILGITVLALVTPFIILGIRSNKINNDHKYLLLEDKFEVVKIIAIFGCARNIGSITGITTRCWRV